MSTISEITEARAQFRAECRKIADVIVKDIIKRVEMSPQEYHTQILNMVQTELRAALKAEE